MDKAGDTQTILGFVIFDGVAARDDAAGFHSLIVAALQNLSDGDQRQAVGNAKQVHGQLGYATHGVYVAQSVGCGNLAEHIGVVYNGGKEVHRLDHGGVVIDAIDASVIAAVIAYQQIVILTIGQIVQNFRKDTRSQLRRSPGGRGHLSQRNFLGHIRYTPLFSKSLRTNVTLLLYHCYAGSAREDTLWI